ncbi:MAG: peptide chain release factor 2 [Bacilli bacterium]|nr:peptide chain release factor 2 [Bacilli bacterium]
MEINELLNYTMIIIPKLTNYGGYFEPEETQIKIKQLEEIMTKPNFWDDKKYSEKIISEANMLRKSIDDVNSVKNKIESNIEILGMLKHEENDNEIKKDIENDLINIIKQYEQLEISMLLNKPHDKMGAILELHSGAGGTEACDWALMLYRMYERWCNSKNYKLEVIDIQDGDEAGIKSASIMIKGINAYGYLKNEKGVHRLVRISPFDSNSRRHTSFASVDVMPLFDNDNIDIEINSNDLRIDVYRSSGNGGQGVNTTDSAVRITHIPTKTVVTCQNERSQIKNKEKAMEVLKNKLFNLELQKREQELKNIKGDTMDVNFGSQIRSYVMHPYSMVKDHRTNTETSNVAKVLDGDIDLFINDNLKRS